MQTIGIWCDECRMKYVQHKCNGRLPCGHNFQSGIGVWCQAFGRGGEHVCIGKVDVWLVQKPRERYVVYGPGAREFWGVMVHDRNMGPLGLTVGEWLASRPDAFVRAFLNRWESYKEAPDWVAFKRHELAVRARALVPVAKASI